MIRLYPEQLRAQLTEGGRPADIVDWHHTQQFQETQGANREAAAP
ncbi:DNA polymerase III subunit delta, partial [Klebsiella pneumoniae]|nr:DNA polymerase III subunit delta [Klebsiella pneumoniae]